MSSLSSLFVTWVASRGGRIHSLTTQRRLVNVGVIVGPSSNNRMSGLGHFCVLDTTYHPVRVILR